MPMATGRRAEKEEEKREKGKKRGREMTGTKRAGMTKSTGSEFVCERFGEFVWLEVSAEEH